MTTTTVTIKHKSTGEIKIIDSGIEFKDYTFVSECVTKALEENPDYDFVSRSSVSDNPVNFFRPTTYGMW